MSLLKARRTSDKKLDQYSGEAVLAEFKDKMDAYIAEPSREALVKLVAEYAIYSYVYVNLIARTFRGYPQMKDSMTYMNSALAEVFHEQNVPYFDAEEGYSCIDKACTYVLDEGEVGLYDYINKTMDEMIESRDRVNEGE